MKRQSKKARNTAKAKGAAKPRASEDAVATDGQQAVGRRSALLKVRDYGIVIALAGGGGWYGLSHMRSRYAEYDLTRIGNGTPAVVQVHDPGCPLCRELQRQTREALASFDGNELQYIVADIKTSKGRELAAAHNVGHVTLLLFDGAGRRLEILAGSNTADFLESAFRRHLAASNRAATS